MADDKKKDEDGDPRLEFISSYAAKSLRLKADKWSKMIGNDEYAGILNEFLTNPNEKILVLNQSPTGVLIPFLGYPADVRTKSVHFIKRREEPVSEDNFKNQLIFGDVPPNAVDGLSVLLEGVFVPILSNPENRQGWPQCVSDDVLKRIHTFRATVQEVRGKVLGQTLLPMPVGVEKVESEAVEVTASQGRNVDLQLKSSIEGVVIKWAYLIEEVIRDDSVKSMPGDYPGPLAEIEFWSKRLKNLENLHEQLLEPKVKSMALILQLTHSMYYRPYETLFAKVIAGITEARNVTTFLRPFAAMVTKFESTDFIDSEPQLEPILHCICLMWSRSAYYCFTHRLLGFLKMLSNSVANQCMKFLDPGSVFQGDPEENRQRIQQCLNILENFRDLGQIYRMKVPDYFKDKEPLPWNFHMKAPFNRTYALIERLEILRAFLDTVLDYMKLDRVVFGGIKGKSFGMKTAAILDEFQAAWSTFSSAAYDPLDPDVPHFLTDYEKFKTLQLDFDRRLAAIFVQAFDDCTDLESLFKLIIMLGSLVYRPVIRTEMERKMKRVAEMMNDNLSAIKEIFDEHVRQYENGRMKVPLYFPQTAGIVSWIVTLRDRITRPSEYVQLLDSSWASSEDMLTVKEKEKHMLNLLEELLNKVIAVFHKNAPLEAELHLAKPVLNRCDDNLLSLNLEPELVSILKEIKYLNMLGPFPLPSILLELYARDDELFYWVQCLNQLVASYNEIRQKSKPVEFALFEKEVKFIDSLINSGIRFLNWNSPETESFIVKTRKLVKQLYGRVSEAQRNTKEMYELIFQWREKPLFERAGPNRLLGLNDRFNRVAVRYNAIKMAGEEIHELLQINYHLLLNIPLPESSEDQEDDANEEITEDEGEEIDGETEEIENDEKKIKKQRKRRKKTKEEDFLEMNLRSTEVQERFQGPPLPVNETAEMTPSLVEQKQKTGSDAKMIKATLTKKKKKKIVINESNDVIAATAAGPLPLVDSNEKEMQKKKWHDYVDYIDQVLVAGILSIISASVGYFLDETDPGPQRTPLFEIALELREPELVFIPPLGEDDDSTGFMVLVKGLLNDIYNIGHLIERMATYKNVPDYRTEAEGCEDLAAMREEVIKRTNKAIKDAAKFRDSLVQYSHLWTENQQDALQAYLRFGRTLTQEEEELSSMGILTIPEKKPTMADFKTIIDFYQDLYMELDAKIDDQKTFQYWLLVNCKPFKHGLLNAVRKWGYLYKNHLREHVLNSIFELEAFIYDSEAILSVTVEEGDYDSLVSVMAVLFNIRSRTESTDEIFEPLWETIELLKNCDVELNEETHIALQELPEKWTNLKKQSLAVRQMIQPLIVTQVALVKKMMALFDVHQSNYRNTFRSLSLFRHTCSNVYETLDKTNHELNELESEQEKIAKQAALFEVAVTEVKHLAATRKELRLVKSIWDYVKIIESWFEEWKKSPWKKVDVEGMDQECKRFTKELRGLDKEARSWEVYIFTEAQLKNMLTSIRAVNELQNPAIRERHWKQLMDATKVKFVMHDNTTLADLLILNLHEYEEEVKTIVDKSVKEMSMEKTIKELEQTWKSMEFDKVLHSRTDTYVIAASEELIEILENDQNQLQNMMSSKFIDYFLTEVSRWQRKLSNADQVITIWMEVQRSWQHLESIFIGSEDIRSQLPMDTKRFEQIDKEFRTLLTAMVKDLNVVRATDKAGLFGKLEKMQEQLVLCEKALADYLETKRLIYPRFYFVSSADLLDILSKGNQPELVARHLTKLYDSLGKLNFTGGGGKIAKGMFAKDGEYVEFKSPCDCSGKVEIWLNRVTDTMRKSLRLYFAAAVQAYDEKPRDQFLLDFPAQVALCTTQIWWSTEVTIAFERLGEGYENALKDYNKKQVQQLSVLITMLLGDLTKGDRQKIMTVCTIDVHSRDVIAKMVQQKVESASAFQWQSQLRHRWDVKARDCFANICDAQFRYDYEYLGCTPRLVITPLTDRCYITLTQSLRLIMGGAPAGPAGTGKTETTKDLGRALGYMVYVFNCSEQMDYKSCGSIYKGLAQTGAWGCFDEFNRISVEVLSVIAVQVKSIQDAIKSKKQRFNFMNEAINLVPTVGIFITMNPGYAGRTELPENLKALFRPCAMVVPDFELICEIMLVAEGFQEARLLARKFITLYTLCRELLSKQDHYDWGLRAIKSVLVVAGSLKRGDRQRAEDQVLMRALRDFNIPKIVTDDLPVFLGLIGDLFPALDVPRKRDPNLEKDIRGACLEMKLQPEENFILKCVQLEELFEVRHSVFIIGFAGTGKTQVWKTLMKTYTNQKRKPWYNDLNPKAVTNDELFGAINPATREWRDGLFSVIMRDQANMSGDGPKWIVLDGDIDPMWIESLNTLMDDNKVLTLASNERIALTPPMRLLFEISNLRTATPATVSRAGILYINAADLGWNPFVTSWIDTRNNESEKVQLLILFDKYVQPCLDILRTKLKKITPLPDINHVQILCQLLNCLLTPSNVPEDCPKEWYEIYFVFACVWAFGAAMFQDQLIDWRNEFSKWFVSEFKAVKFPSGGNVFSYYIDPETKQFYPWTEVVPVYEFDPDVPLQNTLVSTAETTRIRYLIDLLMENRVPVMLVGSAGSGKSVIVSEKIANLSESYAVTNVPFNFYTTSEMLQKILEKPLEKKAGRNYGPPGNKNMIYFIDDMNMPEVDAYGTVQPHTLIRQHIDYSHWYDRTKLTLKDVHNCQYVSCMNPTAGSFTIDPRLQRHFAVFAVSLPSGDALQSIYEKILTGHLTLPGTKFNPALVRLVPNLVTVALQLHQKMSQAFLPTAVKFHYIFNMRDLTNIFQGILFSTPECIPTAGTLIKLWMHESYRVYADKLVDEKDMKSFNGYINEFTQKGFEELNENEVFVDPLLFCHFAEGIGENRYLPVSSWKAMSHLLEEALSQYNELVAAANLVLFEDAMHHVCRINRILEAPRGNALLVGVGGSGKQSLSRLAAFISSLEVFQLQLKKAYSLLDLKADLAQQYLKAGLKNIGVVFLMTDAQVAEEKFLVLINDCLASGEIPELFQDDEVDNIINAVRNEVKGAGIVDSKENCWKFFIDKVRRLLKVVLCFSPVGSTLRVRARKFPALVNCTAIDWFHEWPHEALVSVSHRFLSHIPSLPEELREPVSRFMAHVHTTVNVSSEAYLAAERRYNYTTPKSFLEQISLYGQLLESKTNSNQERIVKLENGLTKLVSTAEQVDGLKVTLAEQEVVLAEKNAAADKLIGVVSAESEKVAKEKAIAAEEEEKVRIIEEDVTIKQRLCEEDLEKAIPALEAAQAALDTLDKGNLTEYKSLGTPPPGADDVAAAVMVLFAAKGKIPRMQDRTWKNSKAMMGKADTFLDQLKNYDKENIQPEAVKAVQYYLDKPGFDPEKIKTKSSAAAGLCSWVINIIKFYEVFRDVEPKRLALNKANEELEDARNKLDFLKKKLAELEEKLKELTDEFNDAMAAKMKCQAEADSTALTIDLANRLVNGLASESIRWKESVANLKIVLSTLPGDVLMTTAFVSYLGSFTKRYRVELVEKQWLPFIKTVQPNIPTTEGTDVLSLLTDDAQIAQWNNEGLPGDRMSIENATILVNSSRWPLMIDPQLQGIKWIKNKYGEELRVVRLGQKTCMDVIETAITDGATVLIEYIGETVDAVLDPLLSRALIRKGRAIKIGDKEVDFNPTFKLILQTKLANPHYQPEMQAQTTLINFTVTRDGLEEQLLGEVVKAERPDLEELKTELTQQQNSFKIALKKLEEDLLTRLNMAGDNILSDVALVDNLETTKSTAAEVTRKVAESKTTAIKIDEAREQYRPVAARASLLYFVLHDLNKMNAIYQFSLKAFSTVFNKAIAGTDEAETLKERVVLLLENVTYCVFMYTSRALFEADKLIFTAHMTIQILLAAKEIEPEELDFLLRYPANPNAPSPLDFLSNLSWGGIKTLSLMLEFRNLDKDIEASAKRWKKLVESEKPEREKLPQEWKNKSALQRLCIMRCLRPDRMTYAIGAFIEEKLGLRYAESRTISLAQSFEETTSSTPIFFVLSPGVDPSKDVEQLGRQLGYTIDKRTFHNVSLGQGQEIIAEEAMEAASSEGHWVMLQNVHLVKNWLPILEKKMEQCAEGANDKYRLFISAEPAPTPEMNIIPQGIVESAIKITNEPPTGMLANIHRALDNFNQNTLESCSKEAEFKGILFALCYFHAVVAERRKFGAQGWNRIYPFNNGDLRISVSVLFNYLENNNKVPWEDLRYLFGEIMYGGHITDDWDRRLCRTYLEEFMRPELLDGDLSLAPGFPAPPNLDYTSYHRYVDHTIPAESPSLYGLHLNAEIGFLSTRSENLFLTVLEMQPRDAGKGTGISMSREDKVKTIVDEIMDKAPDEFNIVELMARVEDKTPYALVAFQELERMNILFREIKRSLKELDLGLRGELTISMDMETLMGAIFLDQVPATWTKLAYPSLLPLGAWLADLVARLREFDVWCTDFTLPSSVWLAGFFNPQSFLTAIMQSTARKNEWPLDKMCLHCEVTKKTREEMLDDIDGIKRYKSTKGKVGARTPPREGASVHGLYMEGARWDVQVGGVVDSFVKDLFPSMPVIFIKAITQDKADFRGVYECPLYKTRQRGPTYVWTFNLKTKEKPGKWTLAGVALLLSV